MKLAYGPIRNWVYLRESRLFYTHIPIDKIMLACRFPDKREKICINSGLVDFKLRCIYEKPLTTVN